ncbi:cupin-like domain-containing protein [Aurantiacibacter sediminis]|uniref:Cupin-like domain-containing protein n=1 Tax=Aurantiacibacter sediminis TaxID=2793064 RepID=A0ABS0N5P3_9SPHN|nr:cupin-like domain-containing protein [Aurantiacibacter sediminis]MBH5323102.1 cupin-like domain-containing protein [Aurantiacibacter sediminis]
MTRQYKNFHGRSLGGRRIFPSAVQSFLATSYPEGALKIEHNLVDHPLLEIDKLALLAESLPPASIDFNGSNPSRGVDSKPGAKSLSIGETIRNIEKTASWAVLKNVEQKKPFAELLHELLEELRPVIEERTGPLLNPQAFIVVSSPHAVTPLHFHAEHNILMQLRGSKTVTVYPAGDRRFASDKSHENYHLGGTGELPWHRNHERAGLPFALGPAEGVYVPAMSPHHVQYGSAVSVSLSLTWRSEWSYAEADARAFNGLIRKLGIDPKPPKRWPATNSGKARAMRLWRRFRGIA